MTISPSAMSFDELAFSKVSIKLKIPGVCSLVWKHDGSVPQMYESLVDYVTNHSQTREFVKQSNGVVFTYCDEDDDEITVGSSEDLLRALEFAIQHNVSKLMLTVRPKSKYTFVESPTQYTDDGSVGDSGSFLYATSPHISSGSSRASRGRKTSNGGSAGGGRSQPMSVPEDHVFSRAEGQSPVADMSALTGGMDDLRFTDGYFGESAFDSAPELPRVLSATALRASMSKGSTSKGSSEVFGSPKVDSYDDAHLFGFDLASAMQAPVDVSRVSAADTGSASMDYPMPGGEAFLSRMFGDEMLAPKTTAISDLTPLKQTPDFAPQLEASRSESHSQSQSQTVSTSFHPVFPEGLEEALEFLPPKDERGISPVQETVQSLSGQLSAAESRHASLHSEELSYYSDDLQRFAQPPTVVTPIARAKSLTESRSPSRRSPMRTPPREVESKFSEESRLIATEPLPTSGFMRSAAEMQPLRSGPFGGYVRSISDPELQTVWGRMSPAKDLRLRPAPHPSVAAVTAAPMVSVESMAGFGNGGRLRPPMTASTSSPLRPHCEMERGLRPPLFSGTMPPPPVSGTPLVVLQPSAHSVASGKPATVAQVSGTKTMATLLKRKLGSPPSKKATKSLVIHAQVSRGTRRASEPESGYSSTRGHRGKHKYRQVLTTHWSMFVEISVESERFDEDDLKQKALEEFRSVQRDLGRYSNDIQIHKQTDNPRHRRLFVNFSQPQYRDRALKKYGRKSIDGAAARGWVYRKRTYYFTRIGYDEKPNHMKPFPIAVHTHYPIEFELRKAKGGKVRQQLAKELLSYEDMLQDTQQLVIRRKAKAKNWLVVTLNFASDRARDRLWADAMPTHQIALCGALVHLRQLQPVSV